MKAATLTQSDLSGQQTYQAGLLDTLFRRCFGEQFNTVLVGGKDEPFYRAACGTDAAEIHYRHDYFRSALHEVAHWCVAGQARRQQDDYGYWYAPDGRNAEQQKAFEQVEVLPQAWELLFCAACGHPFRVSMDNLDNMPTDIAGFEEAVLAQAKQLTRTVPRGRGWVWVQALAVAWRRSAGFDQGWIAQVFQRW